MPRARSGIGVAGLLAIAFVLAGCAAPAPAAPTAAAAAGPSGTLTIATSDVPNSVDPAILVGGIHYALQSVMGQLAVFPAASDPSKLAGPTDLTPELATSWTRAADGSYTFTLRDTTSSAGNPLTSADVLYSFQREQAQTPIMNAILGVVGINTSEPIKVVDDKHFVLQAGPGPDVLAALPQYELGILDSTEVKKHATSDDPWAANWLKSNSASFGPYVVDSLTPNDTLTLKANPNYWQKDKSLPHFGTVVLRQVSDPATRASLIASGQVDMVTSVPFAR